MTTALQPVVFDAPLVTPAPTGLFGATLWTPEDGPLRWLGGGVDVRVFNYGGGSAFGVWDADWCAAPDDLGPSDVKTGERPTFPATFDAMTVWSYDDCDLTERSQDEVRTRAEQVLRLQEQTAAETQFAARLLADAGTPTTVANIVAAVASLESKLAVSNTVGLIHASAALAALAAEANLIVRSGTSLKTPLGHTWVFGGGYVTGLGDKLVASSQVFGRRGPVTVRDVMQLKHNRFAAIAERSLVVGYEATVGVVDIT